MKPLMLAASVMMAVLLIAGWNSGVAAAADDNANTPPNTNATRVPNNQDLQQQIIEQQKTIQDLKNQVQTMQQRQNGQNAAPAAGPQPGVSAPPTAQPPAASVTNNYYTVDQTPPEVGTTTYVVVANPGWLYWWGWVAWPYPHWACHYFYDAGAWYYPGYWHGHAGWGYGYYHGWRGWHGGYARGGGHWRRR